MDWLRAVDAYCERSDPGMWAEPLNALSNVSFFVAAVVLWRRARGDGALRRWFALLIALVGVGSLAFHTFAQVWARLLDVLFIAVFIYAFLGMFLRRSAGAPWWGVAAGLAAYWLLGTGLDMLLPRAAMHGSATYLPAWICLALVTAFAARSRDTARTDFGPLVAALGLFSISLALRTADAPLCETLPTGTHFVWHLLNGWLLYLLAECVTRPGPGANQ